MSRQFSRWNDDEIDWLKANYQKLSSVELGQKLYRSTDSVRVKANKLGLNKEIFNGVPTIWTSEKISFLIENYLVLTHPELSDALGFSQTVVRDKMRKLRLRKQNHHHWTLDEHSYLLENYRFKGDTEIADLMNQQFPKPYRWTKKHISKRRYHFGLKRSKQELSKIFKENYDSGRNSTILDNSASIHLKDTYVLNMLSRKPVNSGCVDFEKRELLRSFPAIIETKRNIIKLKRLCKELRK
jgi:hypothetical protein